MSLTKFLFSTALLTKSRTRNQRQNFMFWFYAIQMTMVALAERYNFWLRYSFWHDQYSRGTSVVTQQSYNYLTKPSFIPDHKNWFAFNFLTFWLFTVRSRAVQKKEFDLDKQRTWGYFSFSLNFLGLETSSFWYLTMKATDTDKMFFKRLLL